LSGWTTRVEHGKLVLPPITEQARGHGTHSLPAVRQNCLSHLASTLASVEFRWPAESTHTISMNLRRAVVASLLALVGSSTRAIAQNLYSPVILRLPAGPKTLALGNTGIASRDDEVIFFNPAQLVNATGSSASGERFAPRAGSGSISAVTRFNNGGVGIGMRFVNYQTADALFPATRASMLRRGSAGSSVEAVVGIAQTIKGFRAGITGKYAQEYTGATQVAMPMADVGISRDFFRTTFGLAVQNIGADERVEGTRIKLPTRTTLGAGRAQQAGPFDLTMTGAVSLLRDDFVQPSGGLEVNYSWLSGYNIALRAGARRAAIGEEPFTAGAGFARDRVSIDYAIEALSDKRFGHRIGLRVR
jgi:hypothetical protein